MFFVFSLLYCKYIREEFKGLWKFNNIFINRITWPYAGLYNYNGRHIELFHVRWFVDRLTGPGFMSFWNAWSWCKFTDFPISLIITSEHQKQRFIINRIHVFSVADHQRIGIVFLFNSKLNDCVEWSTRAGRSSK